MVDTLKLIVLHYLFVILYFSSSNGAETCMANNGRSFAPWNWEIRINESETYYINLCQKSFQCSEDVSICKMVGKNEINYGDKIKSGSKLITKNYVKDNSTFSITFAGGKCSWGENQKMQTHIFFYCDKILGYPEFLEETTCDVIFKFYTNQACQNKPSVDEIPCLIYNPNDGIKRDLSPLIKQKGGHLVASSERGVDVWINVCREISPNAKVPRYTCPKGSASCRVDKKLSYGQIKNSKLTYVGDNIELIYSGNKIKGCKQNATTKITFVCPRSFKDGGIGPVLINSNSSCELNIEWKTDYACVDKGILTQNCTYTDGNVTFNLAKLEKPIKEESYRVEGEGYIFRIKVCSNGQECGGTSGAVCQIKRNGNVPDVSCGDAKYRTIRYADRKLTLIYRNGKPCRTGINRTTIINFRCDPTVDIGEPKFEEEQYCHYFFDWTTRYVCPSRKPGTCSVTTILKGKRLTFDLSVLTRNKGSWVALNSHKEYTGYTYYINVCGDVTTQYKGCMGASACEVYQGKGRRIGVYSSLPKVLTSGSLQLNYTAGKCDASGKKITTIIKFMCKNKNLESPPELESKSWDRCQYMFTWSTAAACSLHVATGNDCVLEDDVTGSVFDLSELKKGPKNSDHNYFTATNKNETFNIKVCGNLDSSQCGGKGDSGVCQKSGKTDHFNAGVGNSHLYYYDGKLNLTYSNGEPCNRNGHPSRTSHITFFCDENVDVGKPVYEKETYCVYHFLWYTKYACPSKTIECLAKDSSGEYDLSSLVKTDGNWKTENKKDTYYINLCRVLHRNEETKRCPVASAVCLKNSSGIYNIGEVSSPLTFQKSGDHNVALNYQAGKCRTLISFICQENEADSGPVLSSSDVAHCIHIFTWKTPAACPVKAATAPGCAGITTANENHVDISSLAKPDNKYYSFEGPPSFTIQFNICKNITCHSTKTSTACLIKGKNQKSIGRSSHSTIEYHEDMIVLRYPDGHYMEGKSWGLRATTVINFICARDMTVGTPVFRGLEKNVYTIDFKTSLACPARTVQCSVYDAQSKKKYNLSPLGLKNGNWVAADTRAHLDYYINVCRPYHPQKYNPGEKSTSCSGRVGGCQVDHRNNKSHGMGYVRSNPDVSPSGDLRLQYFGGEKCHDKFQRSTRINFFCSKIHASPVYMTETEECEYIFNWKTPSACPLKTNTGEKCKVYDTQYSVLYDLTGLKRITRSIDLTDDAVLYVGFCGTQPTNCKKNRGCLVKGGQLKILSDFSSTITYNDETVTVVNHFNKSCSIINKFYCGTEILSQGEKISNKKDCNIELSWSSKLACRPVNGEECSLTKGRDLYDLSVLARESGNWKARVALIGTVYSNNQFYLSICQPLNKQFNGVRQGDRAVMVTDFSKNKLFSLGTMTQRLSMINGFLTMVYSGGKNCTGNKPSGVRIQFVCDSVPEGLGDEPVFDGFDSDSCIFHFTWITKAACPVRSHVAERYGSRNCTAIHPATMKTIDLNNLHNTSGYILKDNFNTTYNLTVCGSSTVKGLSPNIGMCKVSNGSCVSVGTLNNTLVYRQGFLYLLYKNGGDCKTFSDRKMETLVSFLCDHSEQGPKLEKTSECTHYVSWRTPLACEAEIECRVSEGSKLYDLSPLIKNNGNYEINHAGTTYLINVCRSLVSDPRCPPQAAVCAVNTKKNGKSSICDLGPASFPPRMLHNKVVLEYPIVSQTCDTHKSGETKTSAGHKGNKNTTIEFVCGTEGLGKPIIEPNDKNPYPPKFIWSTSLVCQQPTINKNHECQFSHPDMGICFDLTKLGTHNVAIPQDTITLGICSSIEKPARCSNSEVCLTSTGLSLGTKDQMNIQYNPYGGQEVIITYAQAVIILYCGQDKNGPQYNGKFQDKKLTKYVFNWVTPLVCPPRHMSCIIEDGSNTYDLSVLTKKADGYSVKHGDDSYWINICGNVPYNLTGECSSRITAWRKSSKGKSQIIGTETPQKLYFIHDDSFPIRLNYTSDTAIKDCPTSVKPSVMHKFRCSDFNHPPMFNSFDATKCLFIFEWRTPAACVEKRKSLKLIGDWLFSDARTSYCDLDLGVLKQKLLLLENFKGCNFGEPTLHSENDIYDLKVKCTRTNPSSLSIDVSMKCSGNKNDTLDVVDQISESQLLLSWETKRVCDGERIHSCSNVKGSFGGKAAIAVIATFITVGALAALLFLACKPEKRESAALWIRWHVRKYICCRPSYQASYRYKKVNTGDSETDFIIEANVDTVFSDDDADTDDDNDNDDDYLLPLDDDLLNLDEE